MPGTSLARISTPSKRSRATASKVKRGKKYTTLPTIVSIGRQPFPKILRNTVRYCDSFSITSTKPSAVPNYFAFVCNGLFDPNNTTAGHQPMYFDQIMTIYDHYHVIGATITVSIQNVPIDGYTITSGMFIDDDNAPSIVSRNNCVERAVGGRGVWMKTAMGGPVNSMTLHWSANKAFGVENVLTRDDLGGNSGANPTENQCFIVWNQVSSDTPAGGIVYYDCIIDYDVLWTELATLGES